jgi:uncharacterized protein YbaP (TraB family)
MMRITDRRLLLPAALLLLAGLAWLGWQFGAPRDPSPRPALWRIEKDGRQAYLFGTIHAVPRGEPWLSPPIATALDGSDRLFLEVTGLDAERSSHAIFERLARSPGLPAIDARLPRSDLSRLHALQSRHPSELNGLDGYESWAAALLVSAAASSDLALSSDDAPEAVLARRFARAGKPVRGLETIDGQLGLFDRLPEADQRDLLAQSVREAHDAARLFSDLHRAWANGDLAKLESQFLAPLAQSPILWRTLLDQRNRRWAALLDRDLSEQGGTAFVAVGAGHLLGEDSLQARLTGLGWRVERIE